MSKKNPHKITKIEISEEAKIRRQYFLILFLGIGIGGNCLNWGLLYTLGSFIGEVAFISATVTVLGFYFLFFPKLFYAHYAGKLNALLVIVLIFSLLIGLGNFYAFEHGLY